MELKKREEESKEDSLTNLAFKILSEKGIDDADLSMFGDKSKEIYEKYGDKFMNQEGTVSMVIAIKSFIKANKFEKAKIKLLKEGSRAIKEKEYNYALLCYNLLGDNPMINFLLSNNFGAKDSNICYNKLYHNMLSYIKPGIFS